MLFSKVVSWKNNQQKYLSITKGLFKIFSRKYFESKNALFLSEFLPNSATILEKPRLQIRYSYFLKIFSIKIQTTSNNAI